VWCAAIHGPERPREVFPSTCGIPQQGEGAVEWAKGQKIETRNGPIQVGKAYSATSSFVLQYFEGKLYYGGTTMNGSDTETFIQRLDTHKQVSFFSKPVAFFAAIALAFGLLSYVACGNGKELDYHQSYAASVFVSNGDVYVAGYSGCFPGPVCATLWKNGAIDYQLNARTTAFVSIFVAGSDIYLCGYEGKSPALWKNGVRQSLGSLDTLDYDACFLKSIFVSRENVYMAGQLLHKRDQRDDGNGNYILNSTAILWKNGEILTLTNDGHHADANSVYVSGEDVYVAGKDGGDAVLWKNGELQHLDLIFGGISGSANSIFVYNGDVYVAGRETFQLLPRNLWDIATLWKNGKMQDLAVERLAGANSVFVFGGDVYVAGYKNNFAESWKNGVAEYLDRLHR
jgi:hypothetical protein